MFIDTKYAWGRRAI